MYDFLLALLNFDLLRRAAIVGVLVAVCCSMLGTSLVLKRYSMIGDGLSHVAFGTIAISIAFGSAPMLITIPVIIIAAYILLHLSESSKIKGDSAIALISGTSLAVGVIVLRLLGGASVDINSYMFGSLFLISKQDCFLAIPIGLMVIALFALFYNGIFAITLDESFAKASGMRLKLYKSLLAIMTALTVVIGIRLVGALLISSLIIFPTLTSMRLFKTYKSVVVGSVVISVISFLLGLFLVYTFDIPAGAGIVVTNALVFILAAIFKKIRLK